MTGTLCRECAGRRRDSWLARLRSNGFLLDQGWVCSRACLRLGLARSVARGLDSPIPEVDHQHRVRIGTILIQKGLVTPEQLVRAMEEQAREGGTIGTRLLGLGLCTQDQLTAALSEQQGVPWVGDMSAQIDPGVVALFPRRLCLDFRVFPFRVDAQSQFLFVAARSPVRIVLVHMVRKMLGRECRIFLVGDDFFDEAFERWVVARPAAKETEWPLVRNSRKIADTVCREVSRRRVREIRSVFYEPGFWFRMGRRDRWRDLFLRLDPVDSFAGRSGQTLPQVPAESG